MKKTVQNIIDAKGSEVWSIDADASVFEALEFMADKAFTIKFTKT